MKTIYFDYNATTPLDLDAFESMKPFLLDNFGNPSSIHRIGRKARVQLDLLREKAANLLDCKSHELIFTSGGTESNNLALFGIGRLMNREGRKTIISSPVEHHAILHCLDYLEKHEGFEIIYVPVDQDGIVLVDKLLSVVKEHSSEIAFVTVMAANNETGSIQPFQEIGKICQDHNIFFHCDAAQWFGKEEIKEGIRSFNADLVSLCSHKFHGPKGAGILYSKSPIHPDPILFGGGHENDRRAGTENLPAIAGMVSALEKVLPGPDSYLTEQWKKWTNHLRSQIKQVEGIKLWTPENNSLNNTLMFSIENQDAISLLAALDIEGICASSGSACSVGSLLPSHVLLAQGASEAEAKGAIRLSIGRETTEDEVDIASVIIKKTLQRMKK